ncbi:MAG: choice-of-anchor K domain-containing protein [Anaerolineales bacterium]|nr:choice-of-anchor K domain-containing protein [Anaerolineales bacterium]
MGKTNLPGFLFKLGKGFPLALLLALLITSVALALTLAGADGTWSNASGSGGTPTCLVYTNTPATTDENFVHYGDDDFAWGCPGSTDNQSGFGYDGTEGITVTPGDVFLLGQFAHYNQPIVVWNNNNLTQADLTIALDFEDPDINTSLDFTVQLDETTNEEPCVYPGSTICPDKVDLSDPIADQTFGPIEGKYYKLQIVGFAPGTADTCEYVAGETINQFITEEGQENYACLFARMLVEEPAIQIEKTPDMQYITSAGGDVTFDIAVSNIGNVDLEAVEVADALAADCVRTGTWEGDTLAVGETVTYSCTVTGVTEGFTNVAVVTGQAVDDPTKTVTDEDDAEVAVQDSTITIIKDVVDEDLEDGWHSRDFDFTTESTGSDIGQGFFLDDDCDPVTHGCSYAIGGDGGVADNTLQEQITFSNLVQGIYTVTETVPAGTRWILAPQLPPLMGIDCTATDIATGAAITPTVSITNVSPYTTGNVAISLEANQHVTCTFTNKPDPENTSVTLADMKARAKTNFTLLGSVFVFGALLLGAVITRKRETL